MKIRNGFVSNSSSSSFLLKLPHYPTSYKDIKKMLFGDDNPIVLSDWDDEAIPTNVIVNKIYNDIMYILESKKDENKSNNLSESDIENLYIHEYNCDIFDHLISFKYQDEYKKLLRSFKISTNELKNKERYSGLKPIERWKKLEPFQKEIDKISEQMKTIIIKSISEKSLNTDVYVNIEYSDNNGKIESFIEHGNILDPILVYKINNH